MSQTRKCKYCKNEINKKAKICPHCQKKQGIDFIWAILIGLIGLGELFSGYIVIGLLFLVIAVFMELPFIKYKLGKNNESDSQTVPQKVIQSQTIGSMPNNKEEPKKVEIRKPDYIFDCQKLKYFYDDVKISAEKNLTVECKVNETLILSHEEDNEYDENAVAVLNGDRVRLGYLFKGKLQQMVIDYIEREDDIIARIASYKPQEDEIIITLAFYRPIPKDEIIEKFRVSVSESKYSEFYYYMEGSQVNVMYDFDKDKYMIEEFAKLPERFENYADNHDYIFVILNDKENDSGSHSIQIGIVKR